MKNILFIFLFTFISFNLIAQHNRVVFWLHGLGGDNAAFTKAAYATTYNTGRDVPVLDYPARKAYSIQLGYENQSYSLTTAASYIETKIRDSDNSTFSNGLSDFSKNIIIAHSQGGLVARRLDMLYADNPTLGRRINGIVTFGTPHQGAVILNNVPLFSSFVSSGCSELTAGPVAEAIENNFWLDLVTSGSQVHKIVEPLCALLGNAAPLAFNDFTQPITEDYKPNAPALNQLNNFNSNIPKVAFYGIEDKNTMAWNIIYNVTDKKPNELPTFGADDDTKLTRNSNLNWQKYEAKAQYWSSEYSRLLNYKCDTWWEWLIYQGDCYIINSFIDDANEKSLGWQKGANWWNGANDRFRVITGALETKEVTVQVPECNCASYDYDGFEVSNWVDLGDQNGCRSDLGWMVSCSPNGNVVTTTQWVTVENPSDGIVNVSSASNFPGAQFAKEMIGSNHQQMRNDSNTKNRLNELWEGSHGLFFKTDKK